MEPLYDVLLCFNAQPIIWLYSAFIPRSAAEKLHTSSRLDVDHDAIFLCQSTISIVLLIRCLFIPLFEQFPDRIPKFERIVVRETEET